MIQMLPIDIIVYNLEKYLTIRDMVNLRLISKQFRDILIRWKSLRMTYTDSICQTEYYFGDNFLKRINFSCRYCNAIFRDQYSLNKHIKEFNHFKSKYTFNYLNLNINYTSQEFIYCLLGKCNCESKFIDISKFKSPVRIKTLYGTLIIRSLSFWFSGIHPKGFKYIQFGLREMDWKIYTINRHYWLYKNEIYIPIIDINIYF